METKEFKKLLKTLSFPVGGDVYVGESYAKWYKRHGHAGAKVIVRVLDAARAAGFAPVPDRDRVSADATGDRVARGTVVIKGDITITADTFYGQTAYENNFTLTVSSV